jgi:cobaltochelatase CobS
VGINPADFIGNDAGNSINTSDSWCNDCMSTTPAYQPAGHGIASGLPDVVVSARELFKIDTDLRVPAFSTPEEHVPPLDPDYVFDRDTTLALLAGFVHNRRVMVQGRHGTAKSSHVEQVASRLNWPCVRVNLDGHVSRMDLIGKDAIVVRDGSRSPSSSREC